MKVQLFRSIFLILLVLSKMSNTKLQPGHEKLSRSSSPLSAASSLLFFRLPEASETIKYFITRIFRTFQSLNLNSLVIKTGNSLINLESSLCFFEKNCGHKISDWTFQSDVFGFGIFKFKLFLVKCVLKKSQLSFMSERNLYCGGDVKYTKCIIDHWDWLVPF